MPNPVSDPRLRNDRPSGLDWRSLVASPLAHLQVLVLLAVLLGGGGIGYGIRNFAIQGLALLLLAIHFPLVVRFWRESSVLLRILLGATLALPLLQLVPLPPELWQALPGRDLVVVSHRIAGVGDGAWFPLSLDRARTLVAFTGLIAPATIVMLGSLLPMREKILLGLTLVAGAVLALLWGLVQLSSANEAGLLYPINPRPDVLYATFANRNSTGLMLATCTALAIGLARWDRPRDLLVSAMVAGLLAVGTLATQSRSSIVLLGLAFGLVLLRLAWPQSRDAETPARQRRTAGILVGALAALLAIAVAFSAMQGGRVATSLARFDDGATDRPEMWEDGLYAAGQYWPVGSGMGTFDEVFQVHESLEYVSPRRAGRAHSDWIELGIEAGLAGLALALAWLAWAAAAAWRALRHGPYWPALAGGCGVAALALQSLLDYPLRNQTVLCIAALMVVLLVLPRRKEGA